MADTQTTPEVTWAQRSSSSDATRNYLFVGVNVPDVPKTAADLSVTSFNVSFTGTTLKGVKYYVSLDLYAEIDPEASKVNHTARGVELVLRKKELKAEYWPRLLSEPKKVHFLKTDFDKWVDEDEQDPTLDDDYAANFGGFGEGEGLGGIDFSKLGGAPEAKPEANEPDDDSDEEMPELEGGAAKQEEKPEN